ncbi:ice-binding family protein [Kocuria rosea]|uniref:ice-binding family protein n=1 Tax=Kocuria rosea TaxID=1275 RepID=UPI00203CB8EB|nr:ice-binding family protein [Kocuria rosea]
MWNQSDPAPSSTAEPAPENVTAVLWGWVQLFIGTAAQIYLVMIAALASIAVIPALFGWHATVIETGSMEPHIAPGDVVVLSDLPADRAVPVGGVVQFTSPAGAQPSGVERSMLHRIVIDHEDGTYATAGDANADVDSTLLVRDQITGQARLLVPFIGLPALWLGAGQHLPLGLWAAATVAALLLTLTGFVPRGHDDEDDGVSDTQELPALARRGAMTVAGVAVLGGLTGLPAPPSTAAFTARTGTAASWRYVGMPPITLGRAGPFALLASTRLTDHTPLGHPSSVGGSVGSHPGLAIEGLQSSGARRNVSGTVEPGTATAANAMTDARALESALLARPATASRPTVLTGRITPGIHTSATGTFTVTGDLTLDAQGNPAAQFIFRAATITATDSSRVLLSNQARAAHVYWTATGNITLGISTTARGTYLTRGNIAANLTPGSPTQRLTLEGRLISLGTTSPGGTIEVNRPTTTLPA